MDCKPGANQMFIGCINKREVAGTDKDLAFETDKIPFSLAIIER
jgi:hypothetical protein